MSAKSNVTKHDSNTLWILTDAVPVEQDAEALLPTLPTLRGVPVPVDAKKLGENLQEFVTVFARSLDQIGDVSLNGFTLSQVAVDVKLTAELGIVLIGQAGVTGGITLTFTRK